jgi:exonuclease SbcC
MIIQSIRLQNIKSYGDGPDGEGVTISFEPGTNRIAGKNGHGKTTVIESLGYALFLTEPIFEESFHLDTYFLRAGKKAAEIDVTFSHRGASFRIERGVGPNSKRQTKVVQLEDGSTCAEGTREVSAFLCRLFDLPNPRRFSEIFWKLIGVRQGRLTWPFDSKPGAAKDFFEPLLDVAVFRECFESLKPAVDEFMARRHEQEIIRTKIEEQIRERGDSVITLEVKHLEFREIELRLKALHKSREETLKRLGQLEAMEIALRKAESRRDSARNALDLARQRREISEERVRESREAAAIVALAAQGYNRVGAAEKELQVLRTKQAEQHRLQMEIADTEKKKIGIDERSNAARLQMEGFARQKQVLEAERAKIRDRIEALRNRLSTSGAEFEEEKRLADRATRYLSEIGHFLGSFSALLAYGEATLKKTQESAAGLAGRDASALQNARRWEQAAGNALQDFRQQLAAANAEHSALLKQLQEIEGGVCPFLKEQCRQFDPSKVEDDLREKSAVIEILQKNKGIAESTLIAAQTEHEQKRQDERNLVRTGSRLEQMVVDFWSAFERLTWANTGEAVNGLRQWVQQVQPMPVCPDPDAKGIVVEAFARSQQRNDEYLQELENWWQRNKSVVQERINAVLAEEVRRNSDQRDEFHSTERLRKIESEIEQFAGAEIEQREAVDTGLRESAKLDGILANLNQRCRAFGFLGDEIGLLEETQQKYRSDYQRYLGAKPLDDDRRIREIEQEARREEEKCAALELGLCETGLSELRSGYDESALFAARRESEGMSAAAAAESTRLENVRREIERAETRFREWQEACAKRDEIDRVMERLTAAIKLTELARVALRDSAPIVAQHLCDRIAGQAQRIFNRIDPNPIELRWEAAPRYSLRVIPGDRRFAMMSGGEQTKLALAMTLAMIQEFSGLRFCVFDEPTYGVDAESREKLGDVLLESQKAAELEQLILVSHDDAFDGKIENSIFLRKTTADGTEVVESSGQVKIYVMSGTGD